MEQLSPSSNPSVDEIIRTISELKGKLNQSQVKRCVMFADMVGSTSFFDRHGNVDGRVRVELARLAVSEAASPFNGRIVKALGDGWLLVFDSPQEALQAAFEMQKRITLSQGDVTEPIKIKIGLDFGLVLEESEDVYGDVVNVAKRLADAGQGDEILISRSAYESLDPFYQVRCEPIENLMIRGKSEPAIGFRARWRGGQRRVLKATASKIRLEILWNADESRITWKSSAESGQTIVPYDSHSLDLKGIEETTGQIIETIRQANMNASGLEGHSVLKTLGQQLYGLLFSEKTASRLEESHAEYLVLYLDDKCVHIPWELAHDGNDFLCCRFSMGRVVRTSQSTEVKHREPPKDNISILAISDPCGNLPAAQVEGSELYNLCRTDPRVRFELLNGQVTVDEVKSELTNCDILHYCGHGEHDQNNPDLSSWILYGGKLVARDLEELIRSGNSGPLLVFNNACHSGMTASWGKRPLGWSFGLANAFLLAGCSHYVGALSELLDVGSRNFAKFFYRLVIGGYPVGKALRESRNKCQLTMGDTSLTWAQYVLYGDPEMSLFETHAEENNQRVTGEMPLKEETYRVVVSVDMARYSEIVTSLEKRHGLGPNATVALESQIQEMLRKGCERAGVQMEQCIKDFSGDGSVFCFETPIQAEEFAIGVLQASEVWNRSAKSNEENRRFRIGAYDGDIVVDSDGWISGVAVTGAVRLQQAGRTGELVVGQGFFENLPEDHQKLYEPPEWISGKEHDQPFMVYRRVIVQPAPWELEHVSTLSRGGTVFPETTPMNTVDIPKGLVDGRYRWILLAMLIILLAGITIGVGLYRNSSSPMSGFETLLDRADTYEREGNYPAALAAIEEAQRLEPDNKFIQDRLRALKKRQKEISTSAELESVDKQLEALEGAIAALPAERKMVDRWTSRPVTLAVLEEDNPSLDNSLQALLIEQLRSNLVNQGWKVVSRDMLLQVLREQRISASVAFDPARSAQLVLMLKGESIWDRLKGLSPMTACRISC